MLPLLLAITGGYLIATGANGEAKKFDDGGLIDSPNVFIAIVDDVDVYGINTFIKRDNPDALKDVDVEEETRQFTVEYELQVEARKDRIKSIAINIKKITGEIIWSVNLDDLSDDKYVNINQKTALIEVGGSEWTSTMEGKILIDTTTDDSWTIENNMEFHPDGELSVSNVTIDFGQKTIIVS